MAGKIDLHLHTLASDGTDTPEALARLCKQNGISHAAITDHDTVSGARCFLKEANRLGIHAVSGVELNCVYDGEMHILGYHLNLDDKKLNKTLREISSQREMRAHRMVEKLNSAGYDIDMQLVESFAKGAPVGRPHVAMALAKKGYAPDVENAFASYLDPGKPGFIPREKIASKEAIALIHNAGGVAVLAHPAKTHDPDFDHLFQRLKREGLWGVEAYYPTHTGEEITYFEALAKKHGLFITQGSDYHGQIRKEVQIGQENRGGDFLFKSIRVLFEKANI